MREWDQTALTVRLCSKGVEDMKNVESVTGDDKLKKLGTNPDVTRLLSNLKERIGTLVTKVTVLDMTDELPNMSICLYVTGPSEEQLDAVNLITYPKFDAALADHDAYPCVLYADRGESELEGFLDVTEIYLSIPKLDVMSLPIRERLQYFIENPNTLKVVQYLRENHIGKVKRLFAVDYRREFEGQEVFYVVVGLTHTEVDMANAALNPGFTEELADDGIYTAYLVWSDNEHQENFLDITHMLKE